MTSFLFLILVLIIAYSCWMWTTHLRSKIDYMEARKSEIKRRLQIEHKNEKALDEELKQPMDDNQRVRIMTKFAHDRHQRAIHYVIQDTLERWQ